MEVHLLARPEQELGVSCGNAEGRFYIKDMIIVCDCPKCAHLSEEARSLALFGLPSCLFLSFARLLLPVLQLAPCSVHRQVFCC